MKAPWKDFGGLRTFPTPIDVLDRNEITRDFDAVGEVANLVCAADDGNVDVRFTGGRTRRPDARNRNSPSWYKDELTWSLPNSPRLDSFLFQKLSTKRRVQEHILAVDRTIGGGRLDEAVHNEESEEGRRTHRESVEAFQLSSQVCDERFLRTGNLGSRLEGN